MLFGSLPYLGRAPHHHLEHLLFLEQVADLDARQQGGRRATHVARLDAVALGGRQIDLDLQLGLHGLGRDARSDDTLDAATEPA